MGKFPRQIELILRAFFLSGQHLQISVFMSSAYCDPVIFGNFLQSLQVNIGKILDEPASKKFKPWIVARVEFSIWSGFFILRGQL
jgi:hypothetical protein